MAVGSRSETHLFQLPLRKSAAACALLASLAAGEARGATYVISTLADDTLANGNCTLREAIVAAASGLTQDQCAGDAAIDEIVLDAIGTYPFAAGAAIVSGATVHLRGDAAPSSPTTRIRRRLGLERRHPLTASRRGAARLPSGASGAIFAATRSSRAAEEAMPKLTSPKARRCRLLPAVLLLAASPLASADPDPFGPLVSIFPDSFEQGDVCEWSNAAAFAISWYLDGDIDTYGTQATQSIACRRPAGYVDNGLDCNDADPAIHPGAIDICANGIDEDCDGEDANTVDTDGDGWSSCQGDCDDHNSSVHPGAIEICNGIDDDCDQVIDDGCTPVAGPDAL